ncbi:hypothetical protein MADA3029_650134 [Vibrio nigripulchritudo MADA3029]|nr:hypothetical protein VIBNIMADA3021_790066 [Vibrio nigripulchritudo MADA3021]CCN60810.1 hypothetical protein MADA3029_650134 [Vibrio nigripulchritudo MADA3029]
MFLVLVAKIAILYLSIYFLKYPFGGRYLIKLKKFNELIPLVSEKPFKICVI